MSRIGRLPVTIPAGVTVTVAEGNVVTAKGPKGTFTQQLSGEMEIKVEGNSVTITRPSDDKEHRALHGLTRTLLNNMVIGVSEGFSKALAIQGTGYRAAMNGKKTGAYTGLFSSGRDGSARGNYDRGSFADQHYYPRY